METYRGLWVVFAPDAEQGDHYKYLIHGHDDRAVYKADPYAFYSEIPPNTASKVWSLEGYSWHDASHMNRRGQTNPLNSPISIYEVHLGSWRRRDAAGNPLPLPDAPPQIPPSSASSDSPQIPPSSASSDSPQTPLSSASSDSPETPPAYPSYRDLADDLAAYVKDMGYTHVELMPVNEFPFDGSWGYQVTGFFAITSRFGTPQDFMYLVDRLHEAGIGVIVDWVPAHFPKDIHGLYCFDGTCLYEHQNALRREHPHWGTHAFNYNRPEVVSFLMSSAMMLLEIYHLDGIRVDAVSAMLYLDYGRGDQFIPNRDGGNIDYEAAAFLRTLNTALLTEHPGSFTVAEESTAFPMVTKPPYDGGLGFLFKWNMGYMHDTLDYMRTDPYFRHGNHDRMTFSMHYAFSENFISAYSHDEVVHGKGSMLNKMHGDYAEKFASLRTLYGYMYGHPGKKLLFMGGEFGQFIEWDYKKELDWALLGYDSHKGIQSYVRDLNALYRRHPALFAEDGSWEGFTWLNVEDRRNSVFAFMRSGTGEKMVCVFNFTPAAQQDYYVALPSAGTLSLKLNSDDPLYGGSGASVSRRLVAKQIYLNGFSYGAAMSLPPLSALFYSFKPKAETVPSGWAKKDR
jgi:1,4-alpha-glucan branching enzyme